MNDAREAAHRTATTDTRIEYESNDSMTVVAVFSYLREVLGAPDIGNVKVSLSVESQGLSDDQMATLAALGAEGWGLSCTEVLKKTEHLRFGDGTVCLRRLSPQGELLEPFEAWDSNGNAIA